MTTVTKFDAQGFLRQGYSWSKLTGKAPAGVEVFPTGIVVGDKTQVSNGGWYKDADGRYTGSAVFMNTSDLQVVAESPPPSEGVPDPVPAGAYQTVYKGETYANRDEIVWVRV